MAEDWKIMLRLDYTHCDSIYDKLAEEKSLPTIPRHGEIIWPSEQCIKTLSEHVKKCYQETKCKDCPFISYVKGAILVTYVEEFIYVNDVVYDVDNQQVLIGLMEKSVY